MCRLRQDRYHSNCNSLLVFLSIAQAAVGAAIIRFDASNESTEMADTVILIACAVWWLLFNAFFFGKYLYFGQHAKLSSSKDALHIATDQILSEAADGSETTVSANTLSWKQGYVVPACSNVAAAWAATRQIVCA